MGTRMMAGKVVAMPRVVLGFLALAVLAVASPASRALAVPVTFNFTGSFQSQTGFLSPAIDFTGATLSGSFTFESTTPDTNVSPTVGDYAAVTSVSGSVSSGVNSFTFSGTSGSIHVENNNGGTSRDWYEMRSQNPGAALGDTLPGYAITAFEVSLGPLPGSPAFLTSDTLPLVPPALFGNPISFDAFGGSGKLNFTLTSLTTSEVPEPSSLLLLGTGLLGIVGLARKRKKQN